MILPEGKRLEEQLGTRTGVSLKFSANTFMETKARNILCNDPPSDIYMSVFLWDRIFKNYLKPDQFFELQRKNSGKIQDLNLNIDELTYYINHDYIKGGNVHISWVRDAMKFLAKANLAEFESNKDVTIHYHNLQKRSVSKKSGDKKATLDDELHELGRLIAQQYCGNINKKKKEKIKKKEIDNTKSIRKQLSLFEF